MGEMSYAIASCDTQNQLKRRVTDNKVFGFYRDGYRENKHLTIGKQHTESQQNAIHGSRRTDGSQFV